MSWVSGAAVGYEAAGEDCGHRVGLDPVVEIELADEPTSLAIPLGSGGESGAPGRVPATVSAEEGRFPSVCLEGCVKERREVAQILVEPELNTVRFQSLHQPMARIAVGKVDGVQAAFCKLDLLTGQAVRAFINAQKNAVRSMANCSRDFRFVSGIEREIIHQNDTSLAQIVGVHNAQVQGAGEPSGLARGFSDDGRLQRRHGRQLRVDPERLPRTPNRPPVAI